MTRLSITLAATALCASICLSAQTKPSAPETTSTALDKMIAAKKSRKELAQYVFDTQGCKRCHTIGDKGKLGFTETGDGFGRHRRAASGEVDVKQSWLNCLDSAEREMRNRPRLSAKRYGEGLLAHAASPKLKVMT